jgi:hypothetical protein
MTQEEITKGNQLIARFMGYRIIENLKEKEWTIFEHGKYGADWLFMSYDRDSFDEKVKELFKYHSSWEQLMPVVEKIESIQDEFHGYFLVAIASNGCTIQGTNLRTDPDNFHPAYFNDVTLSTKIESTWYAVTQFIQWYNTQTQQHGTTI